MVPNEVDLFTSNPFLLTGLNQSTYSWAMKKIVSIQAARIHLSSLIRDVEAGGEVVIARAGKPVIRLEKCEGETIARKLGFAKGQISDLSNSAWAELDAKFYSLFESLKVSS